MTRSTYAQNVFINCPFDQEYEEIFNAVVFAVFDCGFVARSSLEISDSSGSRFEKLASLINDCKFGYHDISRTTLDPVNNLPRFNMPFELGLFLGAAQFARRSKNCLIVDEIPNRYQKFLSDIAGQDIKTHSNSPRKAVVAVSGWLRDAQEEGSVPGGGHIWRRYERFSNVFPEFRQALKLQHGEVTFNDYTSIISDWQSKNPDFPHP